MGEIYDNSAMDPIHLQVVESGVLFGCADLKFGSDGAVTVLELGEGHTSAFNGAGDHIPLLAREVLGSVAGAGRFPPTLCALVENKVLTHDAFADANLSALRPRTVIQPRIYRDSLADSICAGIGNGPCVLKLADRQRGRGVVIVSRGDLDDTLAKLLAGGGGCKMESSFHCIPERPTEWAATAQDASGLSGLSEHVMHWSGDEGPYFLAESVCRSKVVHGPDGRCYDGTLRVGFILEGSSARMLGSYWKLPGSSLDEMDASLDCQLISNTHGGIATAACADEDKSAVWLVLREALPRVLCGESEHMTVPGLLDRYEDQPLLLATVLARIAGSLAKECSDSAQRLISLAEQRLAGSADSLGAAARSYVLRSKGSVVAQRPAAGPSDWTAAGPIYDEALAVMPGNAGAAYLVGVARFRGGMYQAAGNLFIRSIQADCDFAPAYSYLATCCLLLRDALSCITVSEALLARHPRSAAAHHHIAAALYAEEARQGGIDARRRKEGLIHLRRAKELQRSRVWTRDDDEMLEAFEAEEALPAKPVRTWLFHAWRL